MEEFVEHTTVAGERWDQIAYRYYGQATLYDVIVRANPHVIISPILAEGVKLRVPLLEQQDLQDKGDLPPWKQ